MYLWKSWHDARGRLGLYAAAGLALGAVVGLDALLRYRAFVSNWILRVGSTQAPIVFKNGFRFDFSSQWVGYYATESLATPLALAAVWLGLALGSSTVGREFGAGAAEFLVTRPRSRRSLVWTEWGFGMGCLAGLFLLPLCAAWLFLLGTEPRASVSSLWLLAPAVFLLAATVYGLTQLLTVLSGSAFKGLLLSTACVLLYLLLPGALETWWHIGAPQRFQDWSFGLFDWLLLRLSPQRESFPSAVLAFWILMALPFPWLTQWRLEAKEW